MSWWTVGHSDTFLTFISEQLLYPGNRGTPGLSTSHAPLSHSNLFLCKTLSNRRSSSGTASISKKLCALELNNCYGKFQLLRIQVRVFLEGAVVMNTPFTAGKLPGASRRRAYAALSAKLLCILCILSVCRPTLKVLVHGLTSVATIQCLSRFM